MKKAKLILFIIALFTGELLRAQINYYNTSPTGNINFGNDTIITTGGVRVGGNISVSGTGPATLTLNGNTGTITSPSKVVGFGNDTIVTTSTVKAASFQASYFKTDSMRVSQIIPKDSVIYFGDPAYSMTIPTPITSGPPNELAPLCRGPIKWNSNCGYCFNGGFNPSGTLFGIGTTSMQAELDIENAPSGLPGLIVGSGNVGIGTTTPTSALDINSPSPSAGVITNFRTSSYDVFVTSNMAIGDWNPLVQVHDNGIFWDDNNLSGNIASCFVIAPHTSSSAGIRIEASGNVGIGTTTPAYRLDVNGTIRANEVLVCLFGTCDFVFDKDYSLMPLKDLEQYLQLNHHLPGIASAKEMEEEGNVSLGKINSQLLEKVEELTLYILQQQKEIDKQNEQISQINEKLNQLINK